MTTPRDATLPAARSMTFFFHRQGVHVVLLVLLVSVAYALAKPKLATSAWRGSGDESFLGLTALGWFWLNAALVVVHQAVVALVFRGQLGWGVLTRLFGRRDMLVWGVIFMPFLIARPLVIAGLAIADAGTLDLPRWLSVSLGSVLLAPAVYAGYSVARFFGIPRALGGDHFRLLYRQMPMVRDGAFAWTPNAMYLIVFLGLWAIALLAGAYLALVAALFQHAYIWVHYWCTEEPDMRLMYES